MSTAHNVVTGKKLRETQGWTLKFLSEAVDHTFGIENSNSAILKENDFNKYSKDGHTVLKNIQFSDAIEASIRADITALTSEIANTVGDGTTSAVILSSILFDKITEMEAKHKPYEIINEFKKYAELLKVEILKRKKEFTPEAAYKIAYIATNGNAEIAKTISELYEKYGVDTYIEVASSSSKDTYVKEFDGLTLDSGYASSCYQNVPGKPLCIIKNAEVYAFEDPIDTLDMGQVFTTIVEKNIIAGANNGHMIPTVIMAPKIGGDYDAFMELIAKTLLKYPNPELKPPLLIITNIFGATTRDLYDDIVKLCGCKYIRKYIDPKKKAEEAKKGNVATPSNVKEFSGKCGEVRSDIEQTVFIAPSEIYKPGTTDYSDMYNILLQNAKNELDNAERTGATADEKGRLIRKLHSLKANMIQYVIGGINPSDRDSLKDLVEDAVKSCNSAAINGVGQAANVEGLLASLKLKDTTDNIFGAIVPEAYNELVLKLYSKTLTLSDAEDKVQESIERGEAYDLRAKEFNGAVLGSIMADVTIFETLSKILSLIVTCNQVILPSPKYNNYEYFSRD